MTQVFELLFSLFESVIGFLKEIPLTKNVSLFEFSIAILIMSIVVVAFVNIIPVYSMESDIAQKIDDSKGMAFARGMKSVARHSFRNSVDKIKRR